ncbi:MAG: hypothetical protein H7328_07300 [Bdellovibrio sp.]|nr:hypothetical protein [Bdellovibrio sp.]
MNRKFKIPYVAGLFLSLFVSTNTFAQTYRMDASYYLRSSSDSTGNINNIVGVLTPGSEFKVLNKKGNALQIEITNLASKSNVNKTEQVWIYKGNDSHFTEVTNGPSTDTQAQVPAVPATCRGCIASAAKESQAQQKQINSIKETAREIVAAANQPQGKITLPPGDVKPVTLLDEQIKNYSNSAEVAAAAKWAEKNNGLFSYRKCYRQVKAALSAKTKSGKSLIPGWFSDEAALRAKESLKNYGFINLMDQEPYKSEMKTANQAPKGAVLVYSSNLDCPRTKTPDCGHVEIKASETSYVSDYRSAYAINETPRAKKVGSRYKLVGIMVKPMESP